MFCFVIICLYICVCACLLENNMRMYNQINIHGSKVHCRSACEPGCSGLPYYCTPPVCVPAVLGVLGVWQLSTKKNVSYVCVRQFGYALPSSSIPMHIFRHIDMYACFDYSVMTPCKLCTPIIIIIFWFIKSTQLACLIQQERTQMEVQ